MSHADMKRIFDIFEKSLSSATFVSNDTSTEDIFKMIIEENEKMKNYKKDNSKKK